MKKKVLTLFMAFAMVFTTATMTSFAITPEEATDGDFNNQSVEVNGGEYRDFYWYNINGGTIKGALLREGSINNLSGALLLREGTTVSNCEFYIESEMDVILVDETSVLSGCTIMNNGPALKVLFADESYNDYSNSLQGAYDFYYDPDGDGIYQCESSAATYDATALLTPPAPVIPDPISKTMNVTCDVDQTYTLTIPAETTLVKGETVSASISVEDVRIGAGKNLDVKIASNNYDNGWNLVTHVMYKLAYSIVDGSDNAVKSGDSVLSVAAGSASDTETLKFAVTGEETVAGDYEDTLNFTVEVK